MNIWFAFKVLQWLSIAWNLKYALFKFSKIWPLHIFFGLTSFHTLWNGQVFLTLEHMFSLWLLPPHMPCSTLFSPNNSPPWIILNKRPFEPLAKKSFLSFATEQYVFLLTLMQLYCNWLVHCIFLSLHHGLAPNQGDGVFYSWDLFMRPSTELVHSRPLRCFWLTK